MAKGYFITGTDTGVGKTLISTALLLLLNQQGLRTAGFKPVASGSERGLDGLRNEDALALQAASSIDLPYAQVNPYTFEPAIAPHIAAAQVGVRLDVASLVSAYQPLAAQADAVVVEGAGGWLVPLNESEALADLAQALALPVIMVVGIRLGCINHALLSRQAIEATGLSLVGWVANRVSDDPVAEENIATLSDRLAGIPLLGTVPRLADAKGLSAARYLILPAGL